MTAISIYIAGAVLLVYSGEKLISFLVHAANGLRVSLFLLAVFFTGIEFDDVAFGVALRMEDLDGVAIGTVIGTAMSMTGLVLALSAIIAPTRVSIPRSYVAAFALSPVPWIVMLWWQPSHVVEGIVLVAAFVAFSAYVAGRERGSDRPVYRNTEILEHLEHHTVPRTDALPTPPTGRPRDAWLALGMAVVALCGLTAGAAAMSYGTDGILNQFGLNDTVFGATLVTATLAVEDLFLTVEPVRRGAPEIGVANVIGSVIFGMTGKLGLILLAGGSLRWSSTVFTWHLPALIGVNCLAAWVLIAGKLERRQGATLLAMYLTYWTVSLVFFSGVPMGD